MKLVRMMYFVLLSLLVLLVQMCCNRCSRVDLIERRIFQDSLEFRKDIELILAKLGNISDCISDCLHEGRVTKRDTKDKRTHLHVDVDDITEAVKRAMREETHVRNVVTEEIAGGKVSKHIRNDLVFDTMFILCYFVLLPVLVRGNS